MNLNLRFNLVEDAIQKYLYGVKIDYEILIHFYEDSNDFEEYESISRIVKNVKGYLFCKDCKIEFINIKNLPVALCPQCHNKDLKSWYEELLNKTQIIIKNEKLLNGPLKKSWYNIFKCEPDDNNFFYRKSFKTYKDHSKIYDDRPYSHDVLSLKKYIPKWKNSENEETKEMIELKKFSTEQIIKHSEILDKLIADDSILSTVPPSDKDGISCMDYIAYDLSLLGPSRTNLTRVQSEKDIFNIEKTLLIRKKSFPKQIEGNRRSKKEEEDSITLNPKLKCKIKGKSVLLLDDITTTGKAFEVSRNKILSVGAERVICLALGKTVY